MKSDISISRRHAARLIGGAAAAACLPIPMNAAENETAQMLTRAIPSTGEKIPVVGLGTWQVFDVGDSPDERAPLKEVLTRFVQLGGKVIDSSPMYGRAESVIGDLTSELHLRDSLFLATKVWTTGKQAGIDSMERSLRAFANANASISCRCTTWSTSTPSSPPCAPGKSRDASVTLASPITSIPPFRRWRKSCVAKSSTSSRSITRSSTAMRTSGSCRLARERGVAVLINRPFASGDLFARVRAKPLPDWAAEFECKSWAQFLLKWILGNAAVTCAIPATGNVRHLEDNMAAGVGRLPDEKMRQRMVDSSSPVCSRNPPDEHDADRCARDVVRAAQHLDRDDAGVG